MSIVAVVPTESLFVPTLGESAGVELTKTGLAFTRSLSLEEWALFGEKLEMVEGAIQWWIGDWLNYGEKAYGGKYAEALAATGYEYQSLANMKTVSRAIPFSLRRENLLWSHHKEVVGLEPAEQTRLLEWVEKLKVSVRDLRAEIKGKKNQPEPHPLEELQRQLSRLCPSLVDGNENLFARALETASSVTITEAHAELARIDVKMLRELVHAVSSAADKIQQNIPKEKVA